MTVSVIRTLSERPDIQIVQAPRPTAEESASLAAIEGGVVLKRAVRDRKAERRERKTGVMRSGRLLPCPP